MFDEKYANFRIWGASHIAAIAVAFILIALFFVFAKKIKGNDPFYERLTAAVMLLTEAVFLVWQFTVFGPSAEHLPLNLCTISLYVNAFCLLFGKKEFVKYTAFFSIAGALIAIVVPMQGYNFPHFRYLHYYVNHLLIVLTSLYMLKDLPKITYKQLLISEISLTAFAIAAVHSVNVLCGTAFMFFEVNDGYFATVFSPRNLLMILATAAVHHLFYLVYTAIYNQKRKRGLSNGKKHRA